MTKAVWGARIRLAGLLTLIVLSSSCGDLTRQGTSPAYLIVTSMEAASGADQGTFQTNLLSDVVTVVDGNPTIFNDIGKVHFRLGLKDRDRPGPRPPRPRPTGSRSTATT